ncbi:MAG TPA: hypothetical protein VGK44_00995 [Casimicrobiaceae bacterium]|jgi:hypothetical protein
MQNRRKLRVAAHSLIFIGCIAAISGCSYIVKQMQSQLDETVSAAEVTIPAPVSCTRDQLAAWSPSLTTRSSDAAMSEAAKSLLSESTPRGQAARILLGIRNQSAPKREIGKVFAAMSPVQVSSASIRLAEPNTTEVHISRAQLRRELEELAKTAQAGGFRQLANSRELPAQGHFAEAEFFARYFEYYFRQGHLLSFGIDRKAAEARLRNDLARAMGQDYDKLSAADKKIVDDAVKQMLAAICKNDKCQLWDLADEDTAFITRAGQKFAFPVVTVNIAPGTARGFEVTKIDDVAIVGDLTRVFIEAWFDTAQPNIPAIAKATGCIDKPGAALFTDCKAEADDKLNAINKSGDIAEAVGGYVAAQVVRGAWLASLNNEALAKLVATFISVSARKGTELAVWTAQQCQNNPNALAMRTVRIVADP